MPGNYRYGRCLSGTAGRVEIGADTYRVSKIVWIEPDEATHWIYHRLGALFAQANRHYGLDLIGLVEALQYTVYGPEQHFDWHIDLGSGQTSARKLSMTVQLSDAGDYSGGALEFINAPSPAAARKSAQPPCSRPILRIALRQCKRACAARWWPGPTARRSNRGGPA